MKAHGRKVVEMAVDPRTRQRLERCWAMEFEFDLLPDDLKEVSLV